MKLKKLKNIIIRKVIPCVCVIALLCSFFALSTSAEVTTNNDFVYRCNSFADCFDFVQPEYPIEWVNDFEFKNGVAESQYYQPVIYASRYDEVMRCTFRLKSSAKTWFDKNSITGNDVKVIIPLVFQMNQTSFNAPSSIDVYVRENGSEYVSKGSFLPKKTVSVAPYGLKRFYYLEFTIDGDNGGVASLLPYIRLQMNFNNYSSGSARSVYFSTFELAEDEYKEIEFSTDIISSLPTFKNPDTDIWDNNFGSGANSYFEFENEIMGNVDHTIFNSFWANLSIFDNFGNGIACVRNIMNEFINYNGTQWTWLYNLLMISLYIGMIAFVLGFSVRSSGAISRIGRNSSIERHNREVSSRIGFK